MSRDNFARLLELQDERRRLIEELLNRYMERWNAHDAVGAAAFFTDDVVFYDASVGTPQIGRENAQKNVVQAFMTGSTRLPMDAGRQADHRYQGRLSRIQVDFQRNQHWSLG